MSLKQPTLSEIAFSCNCNFYGEDLGLPLNVAIDSRDIKQGDVFFALPGEKTDGHLYIGDAIAKGAAAVVAESNKYRRSGLALPDRNSGFSVLLTERNVNELLTRLATVYLSIVNPDHVIAITGSVGKTTTREFLKQLLTRHFRVHGADKSYNTDIGCAVTILQMPVDTEVLVLEMGTNKPGEIASLVKSYPPTIALITAIAAAHLEKLKNKVGVVKAKMEIAESRGLRSIIYNADDPDLEKAALELSEEITKRGVGYSKTHYLIKNVVSTIADDGCQVSFKLKTPEGEISLNTNMFGKHQVYCLALAIAGVIETGISIEDINFSDHVFASQEGRGKCYMMPEGFLLIDDSYNANPSSMMAAIETVDNYHWGNDKIAVLGEMGELGENEVKHHKEVLKKALDLDLLILVGQKWYPAVSSLSESAKSRIIFADKRDLLNTIRSQISRGNIILIKGSHSNRLDQIVSELVESK